MTRFFSSSLRVRLLLLVLLAVIPALGLVLHTSAEMRQLSVAQAQVESQWLLRQASADQERLFEETRYLLILMARIPAVCSGDSDGFSVVANNMLERYPHYANFGLFNVDGELLCSAIPPKGPVNITDRAYYQRVLQTHDFAVGNYQVDRIAGKASINFGYPVLDESGQVKSILYAALDLAWLNRLAAGANIPVGTSLTVIDSHGTVLSRHPDPEQWVGKSLPEVPVIHTVIKHQGEGTALSTGMDGTERLYAFKPLYSTADGAKLYIYTGTPAAMVFADANQLLVHNLITIGLAAALMFALAWAGGNVFVLRQVNALLRATQRMAAGDLGARTGLPNGQGELDRLAHSFDQMAAALEQRDEALFKNEKRLRLLTDNMLDTLLLTDADFIIQYASPSTRHNLGIMPEDLVGQSIFDQVHPEDLTAVMAAVAAAMKDKFSGMAILRYRHAGGHYLWFEATGNFIIDEQGTVEGAVFTCRDITARKLAEEAIRNGAARAEVLAEVAQALVKAGPEYRAVLDTVARRTSGLIGDACVVSLLSDDGQWLSSVAFYHPDPEANRLMSKLYEEPLNVDGGGLAARVIQTGLPQLIPVTSPEQIRPLIKPDYWPYLERIGIYSLLMVPLRTRDRIIGTLGLTRDNPGRPYTAGDQAFLQDLADRMSLAIVNARLNSENLRQLKSISALYASAQKLGQSLDLLQLAEDVTRTCVEDFRVSLACLVRARADGEVQVLVHYPPDSEYPHKIKVRWDDSPLGQGTVGRAIRSGLPMMITDIASDLSFAPWRTVALEQGFTCVACLPLISRGNPFGGLLLYSSRTGFFTPARIEFFQAYANQAAAALENARLFEEAGLRLKRLEALHNIDIAITNNSLDLGAVLNVVLEQATARLAIDAAGILVLNPHTKVLEYTNGRGFRSENMESTSRRIGDGNPGVAAAEKRIVYIPNLTEAGVTFRRTQLVADEGFVSYCCVPLYAKEQVKGVLEVFHRVPLHLEPEWLDFLQALAIQAAIAIDNAALFDDLQRSNAKLTLAYDATIEGLAYALDLRDKETEGHSRRVTEMTVRLALVMGLSEADLVHVRRGALLHDIGKLGVPDSILLKPGALTAEEWQIMKRHPVYANEMLSPIDHLRPALDIPYCHHEKWDGTGYPHGLKGEQIPMAARIFAPVDVWDALCSERPYRPAWSADDAIEYIRQQSGKHFDPEIVEAFFKLTSVN